MSTIDHRQTNKYPAPVYPHSLYTPIHPLGPGGPWPLGETVEESL
jgi:hypothetical protein